MVTETMTVHKALAELKLLDERIQKTIGEGVYCVANKHSNDKISGVSVDEYVKIIQGGYDKATDLIKRRKAIKRAVVLSNAVTKVKIADKEYTVAEAIEMKNHGIEYDKMLKDAMEDSYVKAKMKVDFENGQKLDERADKYIEAIYGSKEIKTNTDDIKKAKEDFIKANQYELLNPLDILGKIDELEKTISDFMSEVDSALSCSNALTQITVEY